MTPRRGRSSYLGQRVLGLPDPGAEAVAIWLRALARALEAEAPRCHYEIGSMHWGCASHATIYQNERQRGERQGNPC